MYVQIYNARTSIKSSLTPAEYDSCARICICSSSTRAKYSSASSLITICNTHVRIECQKDIYAFCFMVWCVNGGEGGGGVYALRRVYSYTLRTCDRFLRCSSLISCSSSFICALFSLYRSASARRGASRSDISGQSVCCSVFAVGCSVLQCVAVCCSELQ